MSGELAPSTQAINHRNADDITAPSIILSNLLSKANGGIIALGAITGVFQVAAAAPLFSVKQFLGFYFFSIIVITLISSTFDAITQRNHHREVARKALADLAELKAKALTEASHSTENTHVNLEIKHLEDNGPLHAQCAPAKLVMVARCKPDPSFQVGQMVTLMFSRESCDEIELGVCIIKKHQTDHHYIIALSNLRPKMEDIIAMLIGGEGAKAARKNLWLIPYVSYETTNGMRFSSQDFRFTPPHTKIK